MALVLADRVQETTTTTGTGTVTLNGAVSGFQSFSAVGNGNTTYYTIADQTGTNWEVGLGTYTASGTTLSRDSVLSSSNSGSLVNFGAGTKNVFVTYPASKAVYNGGALGTPSSGTLTNCTGLPVSTGITGLGTNVATALGNNVGASGAFVVNGGVLGTPSSGTLTNATGLPISTGVSGLGTNVATALGTAVGSAGAFVVNGGALGTPSSGTATNLTGLPLSTGVTGQLAIANGGTGQSTQTAAFDALAPTTTKGDLIVSDGSDNIRLAVGTNGYVLMADSAQTAGVKWAAASGGLPGGSDTQVQFNDSGSFGGDAGLTYNKTTDVLTVAGAFSAPAGTASAPSITTTGDTNTGVFFPAADTIGVATGGTERMRLDSSGNVGIGTSSPDRKLDVESGNAEAIRLSSGSYLSTGQGPWIGFDGGPSANWNMARIQATRAGTEFQGNLLFFTNNSATDGTAATERMRLDSSGNLGLGVTPSAWSGLKAFEIAGVGSSLASASNNNLYLSANAWYNGTNWRYGITAEATQYQQFSGSHKWFTAPSGTAGNAITFTQAMTLDASGNLGVGTTSPSSILDVQKAGTAASTTDLLELTNSGNAASMTNTGTGILFNQFYYDATTPAVADAGRIAVKTEGNWTSTASTQDAYMTFETALDGTVAERVRITSVGNVGIGTTSPGAGTRLEITMQTGYEGYAGLKVRGPSSNNSFAGGIEFPSNDGTTVQNKIMNSTSGMLFYTANTERVRIGSGGEVYFPGVGTTASAANAFLNNGSSPANQLLRSTSSLRYKTDVETLDHAKADAVLNLRPVWYRSKAEADRKDWSWYGLIAEEVAQVEPRLVHWSYPEDQFETIETQTEIEKTREVEVTPAVLDDEGNVVEPAVTETETYTENETKSERKLKADAQLAPDGVQYDRLTVMLLDIVKRQNQRIEQLEAKVAALETQ